MESAGLLSCTTVNIRDHCINNSFTLGLVLFIIAIDHAFILNSVCLFAKV